MSSEPPPSASERPSRAVPSAAPPMLLAERDEFIGREAELAELFELWDTGVRLCSIVGTGGGGKTRLATVFARQLSDSERAVEAVTFCDLSAARSAMDCLNSVAWACDITLPRRGDTEALVAHLGQVLARRGPMLLVLDNTEHLLGVARSMLETWLDLAPELNLLVTTRERLRVRGEHCITLGALALPDPRATPADILNTDSVRLFLARARAVHHEFPADEQLAPVLAELMLKLEGLPLAIELCAARSGVLGPAELLSRIERRLETLVSRVASVPRHATLRAALDWSWQLLTPEQQRAIGQCAVFRGGFDLAAAEAVFDLEEPALDMLEALIDKSLIKTQAGMGGQRRYSLLESVVELCNERADAGEKRAAEERHARYFLEVAALWAERALRTGDSKSRELLEIESQNLLAVHARALQRAAHGESLAAALCLEPLFTRHGPLGRFIELLDAAIPSDTEVTSDASVRRGWLARGIAKRSSGDCAGAAIDLERARKSASDRTAVWASAQLGVVHLVLQQHEEAEACLSAATDLAKALGDDFATGQVHAAYAILRGAQQRFDEAFDHDRHASTHFRRSGATSDEAIMQFFRGYLHLEQGSLAEAEHYLSVGLSALGEIGERRLEAHALADLGMLRIEQGRWDDAAECLNLAREIAANVGDDHCRGLSHGYAGQNELERGALEPARDHFERAVQVLAAVGDLRWVAQYRAALACVETLLGREVLGRELFEEAARELEFAGKGDDRLIFDGWRAACAARQGEAGPDATGLAQAFFERSPESTHFQFRAVARVLRGSQRGSARCLRIADDASWFEISGQRVSLARRGNLRRILLALVLAHENDPAAASDVSALFEAGWPGQHINASSSHRVHVAMATLRKLGLGEMLVTHSEGYTLSRELTLQRVAARGP